MHRVGLTLVLLPLFSLLGMTEHGSAMISEIHLQRSVLAMSGGLYSLLHNSKYANTDVLVSLAFARGILLSTDSQNKSSFHGTLCALRSELGRVHRKLRNELARSGPQEQRTYMNDYEPLTRSDAWLVDYDDVDIIESLQESSSPRNLMGPIGNCIVRVMKSASFLCFLPDECYEILLESSTSGYTLTHQLLLALVWNHGPCKEKLDGHLASRDTSLPEYFSRLCGFIFHEAVKLAAKDVDVCHQDLFIEQLAFCQAVGMTDFFRAQWFDKIISWQSSDGCFSSEARKAAKCGFGVDANSTVRYQHDRRRVKRDEVSIRNGNDVCLLHKTSVALIYFATVIKFVIS